MSFLLSFSSDLECSLVEGGTKEQMHHALRAVRPVPSSSSSSPSSFLPDFYANEKIQLLFPNAQGSTATPNPDGGWSLTKSGQATKILGGSTGLKP